MYHWLIVQLQVRVNDIDFAAPSLTNTSFKYLAEKDEKKIGHTWSLPHFIWGWREAMSADWAVGRTWFGNRYIEEIMDRKNELSFPHQEYLLYSMYNLNTWLHLTTSKSKIHVRGAIWNLVQTSSPSHFVRASGDVMSGEWWRGSWAEGCTLRKEKELI